MTNDENPTLRQYSNLEVHGKITQTVAQGTNSDDVVKVGTYAPVTVSGATPTGGTIPGQVLICNNGNGPTYIKTGANAFSLLGGLQTDALSNSTGTAYKFPLLIDPVKKDSNDDLVTGPISSAGLDRGLYYEITGGTGKLVTPRLDTAYIYSDYDTNIGTAISSAMTSTGANINIRAKQSGALSAISISSRNGGQVFISPTTTLSYTFDSSGLTLGVSGTISASDNRAVSGKEVYDYVQGLPDPMIFKGTVGESGTVAWADLPQPTAGTGVSSGNEGWTYKVITKYTNTGSSDYRPSAEVGDTIISNGTAWIVIPSGDVPVGTVTSVATGVGLTGGPITSSGTIKANLNSETSIGTIGSNKVYAVGVDSNSKLAVAVPWTDTLVTQNYKASGQGTYPLLFSEQSDITSTSTRGAKTANLTNKLYADMAADALCLNGFTLCGGGSLDISSKTGGLSQSSMSYISLGSGNMYLEARGSSSTNVASIDIRPGSIDFVVGSNKQYNFGTSMMIVPGCIKLATSGDIASSDEYAVTGGVVYTALQSYAKKASYTVSVNAAGEYTVPSGSTQLGFEPKVVQVYDPDGVQVLVRTELSSSRVTFRTATALSAAQTWTVNIIGW
jgi:hypothetical protein